MLYRFRRSTSIRCSNGQALVELILVLPLFLVLLLGLVDFGRVIWAHNAIRLNAESAARFASVSADHAQPQLDTDIRAQAHRISPAVDDSLVTIRGMDGDASFYPDDCNCHPSVVQPVDCNCAVVEISIEVPIVTPIVSQIVGGSITVSVKSQELIH